MTDVRDVTAFPSSDRINSLNQIKRRDVTPAGSSMTTSWAFQYDSSGNLTSKSDGTNTTTYTWDEDNRLTQVSLPGSTTIAYTYDVLGRMLTKTKTVGAGQPQRWRFEWDGWDIVREYAPSTTGTAVYGTARYGDSENQYDNYGWAGVTTYYVISGMLLGVDFDGGGTHAVISDAQGHVRLLVSPTGGTPFQASYTAYGEAINVTDSTPGGALAARYVGAYGCRWDADTGLTYMRNRWYSSGDQRFITRDPARKGNLYTYVLNNPVRLIDPTGLEPPDVPRPLDAWEQQAFSDALGLLSEGGFRALARHLQQLDKEGKIGMWAYGCDRDNVAAMTQFSPRTYELTHIYLRPLGAMGLGNDPTSRLLNAIQFATTLAHEGWHVDNPPYSSSGDGGYEQARDFLSRLLRNSGNANPTRAATIRNYAAGLEREQVQQGHLRGYRFK